MSKAASYKLMVEDKELWGLVMQGITECAYEFSKAPVEDQPLIITRWTDNIFALVKTMIEHDRPKTKLKKEGK